MNLEELRKLTTGGFRPFKLYPSDDRFCDVSHAELIAVSRPIVASGDDELLRNADFLQVVSGKPGKPGSKH